MSAQQKKHPFDFKTQYGLGFNKQDDEHRRDCFEDIIQGLHVDITVSRR